MCMATVDFSLVWDAKEKAYCGYGFKVMNFKNGLKSSDKRWKMAHGDNLKNQPMTTLKRAISQKEYIPGFHIFLNKEDARKYCLDMDLVKVKFKNVLGFGTNEVNYTRAKWNYGPCIIAEYMKVVELCE